MSRNEFDFVPLLHQILVRERQRPMREVADALGMSYAAFHARVIGRVPFSPGEINALLREVADIRLVDALLRHTRFSVIERPQPGPLADGEGGTRSPCARCRRSWMRWMTSAPTACRRGRASRRSSASTRI